MNSISKEEIEKEGDYAKGEILGLPYIIWRHPSLGHWCGYIGVPKDSRLNGKSYYISTESENGLSKLEQAIDDISVHGGLTYAGNRDEKSDTWYFGFDCGHSGDVEPFMAEKYPHLADGTYKNKDFVMVEVENLAKQLKEIIELKL